MLRTVALVFLVAVGPVSAGAGERQHHKADDSYYNSFGIMTRTEPYHKYDASNQSYACSGPAYAAAHDSFYTDGKCWHFIYPTKKEWVEEYIYSGGGGR